MRRVLINGAAGLVSTRAGKPFSLGSFTIKDEKIVEIDILPDAERICRPDLAFLDR
jgi:RNA polymerase sigma-70 factor (ECF subfamily)